MSYEKIPSQGQDMLLDPEQRLCPQFDAVSVARYRVGDPRTMGMRVLDDCAHVHIM